MNDDWIKYAENFTSDESEVLQELRRTCDEHYEDKSMLAGFFKDVF